MTATRQRILACLMLALLSVLGRPASAQDAQVPEADLKAAFLFNFTKFIEWPPEAFASADAPVTIGVYDHDDSFTKTLQTLLADKKAHGRPFAVKRLTKTEAAKTCQILYFRESETKIMGQVYDAIKRLPILTLGESESFMAQGGMFNFFFEDKQLRFEVNPPTAENAKLTVSSHLLRLAKKVRKGGAK